MLGSGRALRTYGIVRALAAHGPVDLVFPWFGAREAAPEYEAMDNLTLYGVDASRGFARARAYVRARLTGVPGGFARGISPELVAEAHRLAASAGRVVADGPTVAAALSGLDTVVYNAHNLESAFRHDAGERGLGSRRALSRFERRLLERAAESWMASRADVDGARALAPGAVLRYVPNVVDVAAIEPVGPRPGSHRAVFVADFSYGPNRGGLDFLVSEVYPRVWDELPDARLALAGRGLEGDPGDERIERLGFVAELRDAYTGADCAVVPLLEGGGSPLKFVEALAHGLPVVATPKAAAGLEASAGEHYIEGDGAEAFTAALVRVLRDGAPEVAAAGRKLAEDHYSIEALTRMLSR